MLHEILDGNTSEPPNVAMHVHRLNMKGDTQRYKHSFYLCYSIKGTNFTELCHKTLVSTHGTWKIGVEFSDYMLMESNHRHNYVMSTKNRTNFPSI